MHLDIIEKKRIETLQFSKMGLEFCQGIRNSILQKDTSALIEEKIASIGMAAIFTWILSSFIFFTGVGIILFIVGLALSRLINRKVYGKEKNPEKLSKEEKAILSEIINQEKTLRKIKTFSTVKSKSKDVLFVNYVELSLEFDMFLKKIQNHDTSNLSLKYRALYSSKIKNTKKIKHSLNKAYCI